MERRQCEVCGCDRRKLDGAVPDAEGSARSVGEGGQVVKKAFRQLALQYHPDICKEDDCDVQFHRINEAYEIVMSRLRRSEDEQEQWQFQQWSDDGGDNSTMGMYDPSRDLWEEWMGWEGAGIRDYSSPINPYV